MCVGVSNLWQIENITYVNVRTCSTQKHGIGIQYLRVCVCVRYAVLILTLLYGLIAVAAEMRRQMLPIYVYIWHIVIGVGNMCRRSVFFWWCCFLSCVCFFSSVCGIVVKMIWCAGIKTRVCMIRFLHVFLGMFWFTAETSRFTRLFFTV